MNFGEAIEVLKEGGRVARLGWNGKGMFLYLVEGNISLDTAEQIQQVIPNMEAQGEEPTIEGIDLGLFEVGDEGTVIRLPHIAMHTSHGATLNGWLASQTDILAEDWRELISVETTINAMVDSDDDQVDVTISLVRERDEPDTPETTESGLFGFFYGGEDDQ